MVAAATWFLYAWAIWACRDQRRQQLGGKFILTIETVQPLKSAIVTAAGPGQGLPGGSDLRLRPRP